MVSAFVSVDIWILIFNEAVKQMRIYPIKNDISQFDKSVVQRNSNKLHYRDENMIKKMIKRNQQIDDDGTLNKI